MFNCKMRREDITDLAYSIGIWFASQESLSLFSFFLKIKLKRKNLGHNTLGFYRFKSGKLMVDDLINQSSKAFSYVCSQIS